MFSLIVWVAAHLSYREFYLLLPLYNFILWDAVNFVNFAFKGFRPVYVLHQFIVWVREFDNFLAHIFDFRSIIAFLL